VVTYRRTIRCRKVSVLAVFPAIGEGPADRGVVSSESAGLEVGILTSECQIGDAERSRGLEPEPRVVAGVSEQQHEWPATLVGSGQ
jgi:hypothetical protein